MNTTLVYIALLMVCSASFGPAGMGTSYMLGHDDLDMCSFEEDPARLTLYKPINISTMEVESTSEHHLPGELYERIFSFLDGLTLLNLSMTSKFMFNCIHDATKPFQNQIAVVEWHQDIALLSSLKLQRWMVDPIKKALPEWSIDNKKLLQADPEKVLSFIAHMLERTTDLYALFKIMKGLTLPLPELLIPASMTSCVWGANTILSGMRWNFRGHAFWLPSSSQDMQLLLGDLKELVALTSQPVFRYFLAPAVLAHWIIPAFKNERQISDEEKNGICTLQSTTNFLNPFLFFLYECHKELRITDRFDEFMLAFKIEFLSLKNILRKQAMHAQVPAYHLIMTCKVWGLDCSALAHSLIEKSSPEDAHFIQIASFNPDIFPVGDNLPIDLIKSVASIHCIPFPSTVSHGIILPLEPKENWQERRGTKRRLDDDNSQLCKK